MTSATLNAFGHTLASHPTIRSIFMVALLLTSFGAFENATAQNVEPRRVARLVSEPAVDVRNGRPRRVNLEETSAGAMNHATATSPSLEDATAVERRAFEQTNVARKENGLPTLTWDPALCLMARGHSKQMASLGYFAHETPDGLQLKERARANGILHFRVIGENIAYNKGYDDPGGFAVERWLTSSGHRANMLYPGFQASAIGSYIGADGSTYLTQIFIAR